MDEQEMLIRVNDGTIRITLYSSNPNVMTNMMNEMFEWYEDFVKRELDLGHRVNTTTQSPKVSFEHRDEAYDRVEECVRKLKNLTTAYIVLKSHESLCGEVVQVPIKHECYEEIITDAAKLLRWLQETYLTPF